MPYRRDARRLSQSDERFLATAPDAVAPGAEAELAEIERRMRAVLAEAPPWEALEHAAREREQKRLRR